MRFFARLTLSLLGLGLLAGCANGPTRPVSLDEYYNSETTGGVHGKLLGPQGLPGQVTVTLPP